MLSSAAESAHLAALLTHVAVSLATGTQQGLPASCAAPGANLSVWPGAPLGMRRGRQLGMWPAVAPVKPGEGDAVLLKSGASCPVLLAASFLILSLPRPAVPVNPYC